MYIVYLEEISEEKIFPFLYFCICLVRNKNLFFLWIKIFEI